MVGGIVVMMSIFALSVSSPEIQITTDSSDQESPAIYKDIVVWEDERNGNSDIYGYNLETGKMFQITTSPENQWNPSIYKDIVV